MKVYIVGASSGKWDLITVRGLKILKEADVIIHDYLVDNNIFAHISKKTELVACSYLGKNVYGDSNETSKAQNNINRLMVDFAKDGKKVVRLKGGDGSVFSRISEELEYLNNHNVDYEIVPGITSGCIASAYTGIPLTQRNVFSDVIFISGHENNFSEDGNINWETVANCSTIVVYMGVKTISKIAESIVVAGKPEDTPVYCVSNVASIQQIEILSDLKNISKDVMAFQVKPPAIFIVGRLVNLNEKFNWFKNSRKVLFTGLSEERFFLNEIYFHLPMIEIKPLDDYKEFDSNLTSIEKISWIVFTSRYGVEYFFKRFNSLGFDSRNLNEIKIAVIGNSTNNKLSEFGLNADLIPEDESSTGLLREFSKLNIENEKIFIPRSDLSDKGMTQKLQEFGAEVTASVAYKNVMPDDLPDINFDHFDQIFFTSPSTVRNFINRYGLPSDKLDIRCIGDVTYKEAEKWNIID